MTAQTPVRYTFDPCNTDGDDGLFPQIYSVDPGTAGSLTLDEAKERMANHVFGWLQHWRRVGKGLKSDAGRPVVPVEDVPAEVEHWRSIGQWWKNVDADGIEPRPAA